MNYFKNNLHYANYQLVKENQEREAEIKQSQ